MKGYKHIFIDKSSQTITSCMAGTIECFTKEKIDESGIDWEEIKKIASDSFPNPIVKELNIPCN